MSENEDALLELRWQMQSSTQWVMNMAPIFLRNSLQLGTYPNSAALRAALLQWCFSSWNFGANPTVAAGSVTSADDDRMQVDSLGKGEKQIPQSGRKPSDQHDQHELYRHQHVQELWPNWTLGETLLETRWSSV